MKTNKRRRLLNWCPQPKTSGSTSLTRLSMHQKRLQKKRNLASVLLTLGLIWTLLCIFLVAASTPVLTSVRSTPPILIRSDGSIWGPSSALIQRDGDIYTFMGTIHDEISVQKSNIIIDGNGLELDISYARSRGGPVWALSNVNNITIRNMTSGSNLALENCHFCQIVGTRFSTINLHHSNNNRIFENFVGGIYLEYSLNNTVSYNPTGGVELQNSSCNRILNNKITTLTPHAFRVQNSNSNLFFENIVSKPCQNWINLEGDSSDNLFVANNVTGPLVIAPIIACTGTNMFYHNNFVNASAKYPPSALNNPSVWDNSSEGNYWSNYNGTDNNGDGVGDTPYILKTRAYVRGFFS